MKAPVKSIRLVILFVFFLFNSFILQSQTLDLKVKDEPLNKLLVQLRDTHDLKFSFDDELLSNFRVSINRSFDNPDEAISFIIKDLPLTVEKIDGVTVIYPKIIPKQNTANSKKLLVGYLSDASSGESLPYSHVSINDHRQIADGQGRFIYSSTDEWDFRLQISYLGYYTLDTILLHAGEHHLKLQPSVVGIKEIVVKDKSYKISTMSSFNSGEVNLNHQIGRFLPGFADNALYNLLRLQPGVLAAGEQSNDLIIWGSYRGQTEVLFDGFTIFGLKNFNDNIGVVNPNMVQDVRLLKGGYPANYGGKAGAIVDISGTDGNKQKPEFILSATNMTLNSKISVPITNKSVLSGAFRQTYYNLYKNTDLNPFMGSRPPEKSLVDINVSPDYMFRDFLVKYSGVTDSGDSYHFDLLHGIDRFYYNLDMATFNDNLVKNSVDESNAQTGSSFFYGKVWENGNQ